MKELPTESKIFLVYGTLRKGGYNFNRFAHGLHHIGTTTVSGFRMYDIGPYPACVPDTRNPREQTTKVICDVVMSRRRYTAEIIDAMERGAGYESVYVTSELTSITPKGAELGFARGMDVVGRFYIVHDTPKEFPELSGDYMKPVVVKEAQKKQPKRFGVFGNPKVPEEPRLRAEPEDPFDGAGAAFVGEDGRRVMGRRRG